MHTTSHVILKNNSGTYFIDKRLVLTGFLLQTSVKHGAMGQHRGETLVVIMNRNIRHMISPTGNKLLYTWQILTWLTVRLSWLTNNDKFNSLSLNVSFQLIE